MSKASRVGRYRINGVAVVGVETCIFGGMESFPAAKFCQGNFGYFSNLLIWLVGPHWEGPHEPQ